jgi:serine/threonine protein kinase
LTKEAKVLRDARHLNKHIYTLRDDIFYEPFEARYEPSQEYLTVVTSILGDSGRDWITSRDGFWFHTHPPQFSLPAQGWKVHVSTTLGNSVSILERGARIALANDVPFKFSLDKNILRMMGSKNWPRGSSGKFITMYPTELECFKSLIDQLYEEFHSDKGPYILSDKRYKDCRVLYYRYGGMAPTTRMDITGQKVLVLISPDGEAIPDVRTPYFAVPPWVVDPFPNQETKNHEITLNAGKYLVKQALAFSNSGGVYLAEDRGTGSEVVIKEARAHTVFDGEGNDAVKRLKKEREILEQFRDSGVTAKPLELFYEWENSFLAEEYVDGVDLRKVVLTDSPLMRVRPTLEDACQYYETYTKICRGLARTVNLLHEQGVVFGDISPNNFKIDMATCSVRLIDFEVALRLGIDEPTDLHTPGFKSARSIRQNNQSFEDDVYGLAALMLYMLFPIAALNILRNDLFDTVLRTLLADIGWSQTEIFNIIRGLSRNEITCTRACELLNRPAQILPPNYKCDIDNRYCETIMHELGDFILASIRVGGKESLFPADPFIYKTNPLSLGFGACGVLYSLKKCGFEIPKYAYDWLERELDTVKPNDLPPGLLTGASGIAWSLADLGLEHRAAELMKIANQSTILKNHHSYFYGMAGIGMANLSFYIRTKDPYYLRVANELADSLLESSQENERGVYWEADNLIHLGYGYGQSGVALFFLRLHQLSENKDLFSKGRRALEFDLSHGVETEKGVMSFPNKPSDTTFLPYLEEGSAGIAKVALRYGIFDQMDMILSEVHRKYSGFPGLLYGLGSFVDILTDAFLFSNDIKFLEMAKRPLSGIRDLYIIKQLQGSATPGDGLFRISCDYATGVAGVLRTLHRFTHLGEADFVLDEAVSAALKPGDLTFVEVQTSQYLV